jgi:hypothetical protein
MPSPPSQIAERPPPVIGNLVPARREEVQPPPDQPRGKAPESDLVDKGAIAAGALTATARDRHRAQDCHHVGEPVGVDGTADRGGARSTGDLESTRSSAANARRRCPHLGHFERTPVVARRAGRMWRPRGCVL